jgi:hypothetical protein
MIHRDLSAFSDSTLALVQNGLFAMHDCSFKNPMLTAQFKPYVWYMPIEGKEATMEVLTKPEQKLLLYIIAEERKRRGVPK